VNRERIARRGALAAMTLVFAWPFWAWAQPEHDGTSAASAQHHEDAGPAPINWLTLGGESPPFVAMVVNFGILVAGYYLLGKKPIAAALQSRRDSIAKEIEEAQKMKREAEDRAKTYQAKLERLEEEVRTAREALLHTGEAERDRIVAEAEGKAERMRRDAEFLVEQELKQIRQDLLRDTLETAVAAAQQLLQSRVTPADQERLAEDYLSQLAPGSAPGSDPGERGRAPAEPARDRGNPS
jgi:F-type H+-transporting ATPase subunit b